MIGVDEPPRSRHSIYTDLVNLPDPVKLGLTMRIFNYDDVTLYMKVDGYNAGWSFTENNLGSLASGANVYKNIDDFGSRAKPTSETVETVTVRLRAYTDSGYTDLKWTYERSITMVFIKTDDGSWTTDVSNNFDDGTVQGWAVEHLIGPKVPVLEVKTDYVLSAPYSIRMDQYVNVNSVYTGAAYLHALQIRRNSGTLIKLGKDAYIAEDITDYVPLNKWIRLVLPLPGDETFELGIVSDWCATSTWAWSIRMMGRLYKSITTPSATEIYAIINVRLRKWHYNHSPTSIDYHGVVQIDDFLVIHR